MATISDIYFISKMESSVVIVSIDSINLKDKLEMDKIELQVENTVKKIVKKLKETHEKFTDIDFGPTEADPDGAISFYGIPPKRGDGKPEPAGTKYPDPGTLMWERPRYEDTQFTGAVNGADESKEHKGEDDENNDDDDDEYDENEDYDDDDEQFSGMDEDALLWCKHGRLFIDDTSSNDVIQGSLGDCWFLSALSVLGTDSDKVGEVFWKRDSFKEYGMYVLRFFKDSYIIYVIIDDKLPVKRKDKRLIFGRSKDPNELWVPLIEKAYAKLHGSYKSLIGGFVHNGLADLTGYSPRLIVMKEGYVGFSKKYDKDEIWSLLQQYIEWGCLLGCSIQANPKDKEKKDKVEGDEGHGLLSGHAYSLLGMGIIKAEGEDAKKKGEKEIRLIKIRNPWGRGEWEGEFGDESKEREQYASQINIEFNLKQREQERVGIDNNDGTFFMRFDDWFNKFTSVFAAIKFPLHWTGKRIQGKWSGEQGGNRDQGTWISNPQIKFKLEKEDGMNDGDGDVFREVFIGLYIKDTRLSMGAEYFKDPLYTNPVAFDIVTEDELRPDAERKFITHSRYHPSAQKADNNNNNDNNNKTKSSEKEARVTQAPYNYGSTQLEVNLKVGVQYYIVPSLYKRLQAGSFFLHVYANVKNFTLAGNVVVNEAFKPMEIVTKVNNKNTTANSNDDGSNKSGGSNSNNNSVTTTKTTLPMSVGQFYDKKERLRERIMSEAQRLNISWNNLCNRFGYNSNSIGKQPKFSNESDAKISVSTFKRRMVDMGFMLTDFPDSDLAVLDPDEKSNIDTEKFLMYYKKGLEFGELDVIGPPPEPPVDDLLFKAPDISGDLTVHVSTARFLRNATTWFNSKTVSESRDGLVHPISNASEDSQADNTVTSDAFSRQYIKYDAVDASKHHNSHKQNFGLLVPSLKGINNKSSKDNTEAVMDVDTSIDMVNSPRSVFNSPNRSPTKAFLTTENINKHNNKNGLKSKQQHHQHRDGYLITEKSVTGMSASRRKVIEESGTIAAKRLHIDSELQSAELKRTEKLSQFRNAWKNKQITSTSSSSSSLDSAFEDKALIAVQKKLPIIRNSKQDKKAMFLLGIGKDPDAKDNDVTIFTRTASNITSSSNNSNKNTDDAKLTSIVESNESELNVMNNNNEKKQLQQQKQQQGDSITPTTKSSSRMNEDIWDYLVDCVISIIASRPQNDTLKKHKAILSLKRTDISIDSYKIFSQPLSRISTPSVVLQPVKATKGHASVSRSFHQTPGRASVKSQVSAMKLEKTFASEVVAKVSQVSKDRENKFQEIYRRIVLIPVTTRSEIEGDKKGDVKVGTIKSHGFLNTIFKKFDKNSNGIISRDELKLALQEMNMEVDDCDCDLIFNRFSSGSKDGIAWTRFLSFFESQSTSAMNSFASSSTSEKKEVNMIDLLNEIKQKLRDAKSEMEKNRLSTLDQLLDIRRKTSSTSDDVKKSTNEDNTFKLPSDPFFQKLDISSMRVKLNRDIMRKLGISITEDTMKRVSRIFLYSNTLLMKFVDSRSSSSSSSSRDSESLRDVLKYASQMLSDSMHQRMGSSSDTSVLKLWISIASSQDSVVSFEDIAAYFMQLLLESPEAKKKTVIKSSLGDSNNIGDSRGEASLLSVSATSDLKKDSTQYLMKISDDNVVIRDLDVSLMSRIIADHVIASVWNNPRDNSKDNKNNSITTPVATTNTTTTTASSTTIAISADPPTITPTCLSYSGLSAYLRRQRIHHLEMKFKFIMQMEAAHMRSTTTMMMHVYINGRQDELIFLAHDPISGEVLKLNVRQDLKGLPSRDKLDVLFESHSKWMEELCRKGRNWFNPESIYYFNPWNTPAEDKCISDFIERLNVVRTSPTSSYLHVGEDPKFVNVLRKILQDSSALPIFCSVNNLVMTFEVDENNLITSDGREISLRAFIFNKIRHYKKLYNFIVNSQSSLNIVLTTYNGGLREVMRWSELLAHLTNNRNPFFTIQLLPKVFKPDDPDDYFYYLDDYDHNVAYSLQDGRSDAASDMMMIQRSFIDLDGAPHPSWNQKFKFKFTQPLLTSCRVVSSEVIKIKVDLQDKYVILLLRDSRRNATINGGPDKFRFITIYDPRSATEYQCGIKEGCKLYNALYYGTIDESLVAKRSSNKAMRGTYDNCSCSISGISDSDYMAFIVEASEQHKIVLGPAITPRLEIHVYNDNGRSQELLGSAQISISSVLSGTGIVEKRWHCLNYKVDNNSNNNNNTGDGGGVVTKSIDVVAGDIELEMKFVSHGVLEAEKNSELNVEKRKSKLKSSNKLSESTKEPTGGDQELNTNAADNDDDDGNRKEGSKGKGVGSSSSTRKELESLRMEKDTLALQCQKLRDKLSSSSNKGGSNGGGGGVEQSNLDDKIVSELQATKEQKEKLAKENKVISDERQQLVAEIAKLKNQIKGSQQLPSSVATSSEVITSKLEEENIKLLEENKRLKEVEAVARKQLEQLKFKEDEKGAVKSVTTVLPSITSVDGIVKVLMERYEKRRSNGGVSSSDSPLDSLQRLLLSYSSKGNIASKHIYSCLSDLMIDVSMDQVMKICEEIGYEDPSVGVVSTSKVLDYFKRQLDSLSLNGSNNKDGTGKKDHKVTVDEPLVIASALSKPALNEEQAVRISKDESKDRIRPKSAMEASISSPSPSGLPSNNNNNNTFSSSSIGMSGRSVDWTREPVTYPWERRFHTETNKYIYINHDTKSTQWHHPLDKSKSKRGKNKGSENVARKSTEAP